MSKKEKIKVDDRERKIFLDYLESDDYKKKLIKRLKIQESCSNSTAARISAYALCKKDIEGAIFFIENFGWTFDPRGFREPNNLPFFLFDYQKDYVKWLINHIRTGTDGLVEKSRDMGVTWVSLMVLFWFWLFEDAFAGHLGSRKEALVDNRTIDSLLGIIDYQLRNTPDWLLPKGFDFRNHRQHMKLINPETNNIITGESMNPDFGRQSRKNVAFFDEMAFWDAGMEAWESCGDTTPCRIAVSTPAGHNFFAFLRESGLDVMTLHWKLHPFKDQKWYEYQQARRTEEEIAQELDISYQKSQAGQVYPEWQNVPFGFYSYNPSIPLYVSWDYGQTDDTAIIWWQTPLERTEPIRIIDCYWNRGKTIDFYIPFMTGDLMGQDYRYNKKDLKVIEEHKSWKNGVHFGDPAGRFTNQVTNQSVMDVLRSYGIHVRFREQAKDFQTRKTDSKLLMKNLVVNENERTKYLGTCMENAHYPRVRERGGVEGVRSVKPVHDWTSHLRSAFEYFAVNFNKQQFQARTIYDKFPPKRDRTRIITHKR